MELIRVDLPRPLSPTTIRVNSKPRFTAFLQRAEIYTSKTWVLVSTTVNQDIVAIPFHLEPKISGFLMHLRLINKVFFPLVENFAISALNQGGNNYTKLQKFKASEYFFHQFLHPPPIESEEYVHFQNLLGYKVCIFSQISNPFSKKNVKIWNLSSRKMHISKEI